MLCKLLGLQRQYLFEFFAAELGMRAKQRDVMLNAAECTGYLEIVQLQGSIHNDFVWENNREAW